MRAKIWSLLFLVGLSAGAQAATNFWDAATNAGYQHGDGNWSTNAADTNWTSAGIAPRTTWTNGDSANFNSTLAGSSCVMVSGVVTAGAVSIVGSYYSLNITNGGVICITNGMSIGTIVANNPNSSNVVRVIGGAGVTSVWNNGMTSFALSGRPSKGNTFIVDGAGVAGSAVATNMGDLSVGISDNTDVSVIVTNKGELHVRGVIRLGGGRAETNISLTIAMGGILRTTNNTSLGWKPSNGPGLDVVTNTLIVRDAGSLFDGGGARLTLADFSGGGLLISHWNTRMILDGGMITNVSFGCGVDNSVGQYFRQNEFSSFILVTNGGRMYCGAAYSTLFHMVGPLNYVRNNNDLVTGMNTLWNNGGKALWYTFNSRVELACSDNAMTLDDGALMTNVGAFSFASGGTVNNQFVITNGARLFSTNGLIGAVAPATSNKFVVTGSRSGTNSLWDLGGGSLQIGAAASVNNSLTIDQGGRVDNVGTLTIYGTNYVYLLGGALASSNMIQTNGLLFTVGDGFQVATLKLMGGFGTFTSGLLVQSNATLLAGGAITGGVYGVSVTNGATFSPGSSGVGALTIGGSNLTWGAGATYVCEIANFVGGAGVGYDTINVSSQLALVADVGSSSLVIRISSMGALAANFVTNATYNLLVASSASLAGFDSTKFTVNTDDFLNTVDGTWGVMSLNNGLYVTYSPLSETGLACTWAAPTNGNWTVGVNWLGGTPPSASSPEMQLTFGGSASESAYSATNDNAGNFQLNRLVLNNANAAVTNRLAGNPMQFWNADAAIEQSGSGSFIVSNVLNTVTGLVFRGTGAGSLTIASNITVAGSMVVQGAGTVFMNGSNSYLGPLLVNAPGGILQLNNLNALPTNSLVVSNGT
ncbi:MAG: hypothetical protein WCL16_06435, partial [bacterium]